MNILDVPIHPEKPEHKTFNFANGVTVSSDFDSGNLAKCYNEDGDTKKYICWLSGDAMPYSAVGHY